MLLAVVVPHLAPLAVVLPLLVPLPGALLPLPPPLHAMLPRLQAPQGAKTHGAVSCPPDGQNARYHLAAQGLPEIRPGVRPKYRPYKAAQRVRQRKGLAILQFV